MEPNPTQNLGNGGEKIEHITQTAIRVKNGKIFTGENHAKILAIICEEDVYLTGEREEGFVTSKGRFVSRGEAEEIAFKAGQIKEKVGTLSSQDLRL